MKPSESEALALLFTGRYNVAVMANDLGVDLFDLQILFSAYCKDHPPVDYALLDQAINECRERSDAKTSAKSS